MADFEPDGASSTDPFEALSGLVGLDGTRVWLENVGHTARLWQREGRSTAGLLGNMVFAGVCRPALVNAAQGIAMSGTALT